MPQQTINIGAAPDDGTGDTIRVGGDKINDNFTELYTDKLDKAGGTLTGDLIVPDEAYDATAWNGSLEVPTKNALRDKIETLASGTPTELDDLTDVNAPTPSNGDVLTWDSTPGEWVSLAPSGGIAELDDIPDVNAPTPSNGDVLTWDSTPGEWVASAPTGGSNALDDLTDVDAPTPSDGDVLTFDSGSGDWVPAAPAGGGSSYERTRAVPVVADFTLQNAGTASISDVTSGIKLLSPSASSNLRFVRHNAALPATPWTVIARIAPLQPRTDTTQFQRCLVVRNSNGRMLMMHERSGPGSLVVDRWAGYTAPAANAFGPLTTNRMFEMPWQRITFDGTTFAFGCSPDGHNDTFHDFYTEAAATYLTAVGGTISEVGWGNWVDSGSYTIAELLQSFEVF